MAELTKGERLMAGRLLEIASNLFSSRNCNDTEPELFAGVDQAELNGMLTKIRNAEDDAMEVDEVPDWLWMSYLSERLLAVD